MDIIDNKNFFYNMIGHRFTLDHSKPRKKYTCPQYGRPKCFTRYVDTCGEIAFPDNVGMCDHASSCRFHYAPKDFFRDNPGIWKEPVAYLPFLAKFRSTMELEPMSVDSI